MTARAALSGTYTNNVSLGADQPERQRRSDGRTNARRSRYRLRDFLREHTTFERVRKCGHTRIAPTVQLVRRADGSAGLLGLARCASVWVCPCCAPGIAAARAIEIGSLITWAMRARQASAYMLSLTVRHAWSDSFKLTLRGVANAWRRFCQGSEWKAWKARVGFEGFVRGLEATHGANGWHPHLHVLFLVRDPLALEVSWEWLAERWQRCVAAELGEAYEPDLVHGAKLTTATAADYIVKLGLELTSIGTKGGKNGNRTPWEIAFDARSSKRDLAIWLDYADATHNHRQLTWSRGLRKAAGLAEQDSDADLLEAERQGAVVLAELPSGLWEAARAQRRSAELLEAAERDADHVARLLDDIRRVGGFPLHRARDPGT